MFPSDKNAQNVQNEVNKVVSDFCKTNNLEVSSLWQWSSDTADNDLSFDTFSSLVVLCSLRISVQNEVLHIDDFLLDNKDKAKELFNKLEPLYLSLEG